jgi:HSP20 family molecular chaperone IbpA
MTALTFRNNNTTGFGILDEVLNGWGDIYRSPVARVTQDRHEPKVKNNDSNYEIVLTSPGLEKKDFRISVEKSLLMISYDVTDQDNRYAYETKYSKKYELPNDCDTENITAAYKNGILVVSVPKTPATQPRQIKIK